MIEQWIGIVRQASSDGTVQCIIPDRHGDALITVKPMERGSEVTKAWHVPVVGDRLFVFFTSPEAPPEWLPIVADAVTEDDFIGHALNPDAHAGQTALLTYSTNWGEWDASWVNGLYRFGRQVTLTALIRRLSSDIALPATVATIPSAHFRPVDRVMVMCLSSLGTFRVDIDSAGAISLQSGWTPAGVGVVTYNAGNFLQINATWFTGEP